MVKKIWRYDYFGEEGIAIRIYRRRLSIFGHVRRLPEATPAHSALRLAVDARAGSKPDWVEAPAKTTLPNVGAADRGQHWAQRQRRLEDRTWPQVLEGATTSGRSSVPLTIFGAILTENVANEFINVFCQRYVPAAA